MYTFLCKYSYIFPNICIYRHKKKHTYTCMDVYIYIRTKRKKLKKIYFGAKNSILKIFGLIKKIEICIYTHLTYLKIVRSLKIGVI
jgi:hypothetical protein